MANLNFYLVAKLGLDHGLLSVSGVFFVWMASSARRVRVIAEDVGRRMI